MRGPLVRRPRLSVTLSAGRHSAVMMNRVRRSGPPSASANRAGSRRSRCVGVLRHPRRRGRPRSLPSRPRPRPRHRDRCRPARDLRRTPGGWTVLVRFEVERGQASGERLGDDQRPVVRRDDHAVRELDVARDLADGAVRPDELDVAGFRRLAAGEVEVRAVEVGPAVRVHDDLVATLVGDDAGRPVLLVAPKLVAGRQHPAVRQPIDGPSINRSTGTGVAYVVPSIATAATSWSIQLLNHDRPSCHRGDSGIPDHAAGPSVRTSRHLVTSRPSRLSAGSCPLRTRNRSDRRPAQVQSVQ